MIQRVTKMDDETRIRANNKRQLCYITDFLEIFFAWPKEGNPDNVNFKLFLKTTLFLSAAGFPALFTVFHMYHFRSATMTQLTEDLVVVLHVICPVVMALIYLIHLKETVRLFQLLPQEYHWRAFLNKDRIDYKRWTRACKIVFLLTTVAIMLHVEFDYDNCQERKIKSNNSIRSCGVFIPYYLPFDFRSFPIRHYVLLHQEIGILVGFLVLHHTLYILIFYIDKTICLMDYMISLVAELNTSIDDDRKVEEHLRQIIDVHLVIIRFNKWLNKISRYFQMSVYTSGRVVIAVLIFHTIKVALDEYFVYSLIWVVGVSSFPIGSQLLINKSMELETAVYNVEWYKMNNIKDRRSYYLIYRMSQRPIALEAGPYLQLSFSLLLETYKEIYSFTAMLIRLNKK